MTARAGVFFTGPVRAEVARRLGPGTLREAMTLVTRRNVRALVLRLAWEKHAG